MNNLKKFDINLQQLTKSDYLCGMDEVGRGSMCGSFVAACVILPDNYDNPKINDSKKLTQIDREELEIEIKENAIYYKILEYSAQEIDSQGIQIINILAFESLMCLVKNHFSNVLFLADGNIMKDKSSFYSIEKGDSKSFSIACASILAKTYRDAKMLELSKEYPDWQLDKNKGYGIDYINLIKQYGYPEKIHRKSYKIKNDKQIKLF